MRASLRLSRLFRRAVPARFPRDQRGIVAVEFAFIAPIALLLLYGEYTLSDAFSAKRKLTITAHTIADLVAQKSSVSSSMLTSYLNASAQIMAPYSTTPLSIVVSELTTDASGNTTVTWSSALNGTALTTGAKVTLPTGLAQNSTSLIWSTASYTYTPLLGQNVFGVMNFNSQFYTNPRIAGTVSYTN
jgi:Flp pilus assembly protein TadG